jgi:cysteine desulfurase
LLYLDHCGSTPLAKEVEDSILNFLKSESFGNPSAVHHEVGKRANELVSASREAIAHALGAKSNEIIFTSGATEANNLLLWGFALRYRAQGCHIIFGATEHKSVFDTCSALSDLGGVAVTECGVDASGEIDLDELERQLALTQGQSVLVALMHMNNEIPARHPVESVSRLCTRYGAFFHCDGVQGYVRERLDFASGLYGSYVISTHKIYGPKGLGLLVFGSGPLSTRITSAYHGGSQEAGLRPGTLNTLAIVAGAATVALHESKRAQRVQHMAHCAEAFVNTLSGLISSFKLTTPLNSKVAGIVNFYFEDIDAPTLLASLKEVCINRGASCTGSGGEQYSHVPKALGLPVEVQANVLRASFGDAVSMEDSKIAAARIAERVRQLVDERIK